MQEALHHLFAGCLRSITTMSDSQYGYATGVLTSKTPQNAAALVDAALRDTKGPVTAGMLDFFSAYSQAVQRHNQNLTHIVQQATLVFGNGAHPEHGNLEKVWGTLLSSIQNDIHANDVYFKNLKLDCVGPLRQLNDNELGYSELLVNSQELNLVASKLASGGSDAEYQWNIKAPQTFDNLENYKRHEKQLLFDCVLNYFNATNSRYSKSLTPNEKAVNYLLGEFRINHEMEQYLQYLLARKVTPAPLADSTSPQKKRLSSQPLHHDQASLHSANTSSSSKKPSKLRSRVGSIFGRKSKKNAKSNFSTEDVINESESASSTPRLTSKSTESFNKLNAVNPPAPEKRPSQSGRVPAPTYQQNKVRESRTPDFPDDSHSPNVVKYDGDASSVESSPPDGKRLSMLKQHDLDPVTPEAIAPPLSHPELRQEDSTFLLQPPTQSLELLDVSRSRQSSGGKYSFEEGDDKKPVATSPRINRSDGTVPNGFEPNYSSEKPNVQPTLPEPDVEAEKNNKPTFPSVVTGAAAALGAGVAATAATAAAYGAIDKKDPYEDKQVPPPPPPPSRKVAHHPTSESVAPPPLEKPKSRRDVNSQMFHNLPGARESFAPPPALVSQDTGSSLLRKSDYFKHFDSGKYVESAGLNASIAEVINVTFKDEELTTSQVVGEIAFVYNGTEGSNSPISLRIPRVFNKVLENNSFVERSGDENYTVDPSKILSRTLGGLKYMINLNESQIPVIIQQIWKFEDHQASLMVNLKLNSAYSDSLRLDNFVVSIALSPDVQSTSASSRPQGSFSKEKNRITWRYPSPLVLNNINSEEKLIARFLTNGKAKEHESGLQLRFSIIDPPAAWTTIYTADGQELPSARHLVSGTYTSHS